MDSDLKDRLAISTSPRSFNKAAASRPDVAGRKRLNGGTNRRPPVQLIHDVSRVAGRFQRSALGYLDHTDWHDRMRADGQHLIDLLADMGFTPTRPS